MRSQIAVGSSRRVAHVAANAAVRSRRGITLILVGLCLTVLVGFVALGIDMGRVYLAKTDLQVAADAAARAAVRMIPSVARGTRDWSQVVSRAVQIAANNTALGSPVVLDSAVDVEFGIWRIDEPDPTQRWVTLTGDARVDANAVKITARRVADPNNGNIKPVELYFAPVVGWSTMDVKAISIAMLRGQDSTGLGYGIVGLDSVSLNGITSTDSYNATLGAYGVNGNVDSFGTIASDGNISLVGTVTIHGDAHAGPDYPTDSLSINSNSSITGWQSPLDTNLIYPAPVLGSYSNSPIATDYLDSNNNFVLNGKASATIPAGSYFVNDLKMTGNTTINVSGPVTIYVNGNVDLTGSVNINQGLPADLKIVVLNAGSTVDLGGGSELFAQVYAPLSDVKIHGTSSNFGFFGSVVGKTLTVSGNSAIHYDESQGLGNLPQHPWVQLVR